jgi:uncharacterized protein YprB with RNaseH-like and TPR domain
MEQRDRLRQALKDAGLARAQGTAAGGAAPADVPHAASGVAHPGPDARYRPAGGGLPDTRHPTPGTRRVVFQHGLAPPRKCEAGIELFLPGFWQDTPVGRVFVVEQRFDLDHQHGAYRLDQTLSVPGETLARIGRQEALREVEHPRLLYLDTETTGLSGGAGTVAFLVGIGHFLDGGFRLRQYFLDSLEHEEALLRALSDYLEGFDGIVTFNGKAFDLPLLEARFILARRRTAVRSLPHLDLLFPARRLYRDRFGSCRLGELERQVLGLTRQEDVPSFEIPSLYFRYVRQRRFRALLPVFQHNALDVLSMVTLTAHLGDLYRGAAPAAGRAGEDSLALGRVCEGDGYHEEAIGHYGAALAAGLPPVPRDEAERALSLLYKRLGRWEEAVMLWQQVADRAENRALYPLVELARYCERGARDLDGAIRHTERALDLLRRHHLRLGAAGAATEQERIERRLTRLQERAARANLSPRPPSRAGRGSRTKA